MPDTVAVSPPTTARATGGLAPFSLRDAPALIERVFPAQKVGAEAQKERKANVGQTLTGLGSYWKGRKPLVLVRATVLASLLPATDDPEGDLDVFEALMRMDEEGIARRGVALSAADVLAAPGVCASLKALHIEADDGAGGPPRWRPIPRGTGRAAADEIGAERSAMARAALRSVPYARQVGAASRAEEVEDLLRADDPLYEDVWDRAARHLGTASRSLPDLVGELGVARFGRRPVVGDPFSGGGSIPFEAARVGCDVVASDLNPVAAMLTWGALNLVGAPTSTRARVAAEQARVAAAVAAEIEALGFEREAAGNRAKAYLYCLETVDPQTGWRVPMAPSWVISHGRRSAARLVPDHARKRFDIVVESGLDSGAMERAASGTVREGHLVYTLAPAEGWEPREWRVPIARLRGDGEGDPRPDGGTGNRLRPWDISDVAAREPVWDAAAQPVLPGSGRGAWVGGDVFAERLYAVQWIGERDPEASGRRRPPTWFAAATADDLRREREVADFVRANLGAWQAAGLVPDMRIEPGEKTDEPLRTRGWTHWHHLFCPRQILTAALFAARARDVEPPIARASCAFGLARLLDNNSRLSRWSSAPGADQVINVFSNQALNTIYNFGARGASYAAIQFTPELSRAGTIPPGVDARLRVHAAAQTDARADAWVFDPPYADAVHYHEITEFFIAWLRKNPPAPFDQWVWDSRRPLAIQGKGEKFRADMVAAFSAMARNMPDNGLQVCMFTHKDAGVWADMASVVWASGLRVTAAWYVSTETESELKKGGHVQGTVLLALRKRGAGEEHGYRSDIVPEVRERVRAQVETLTGLNQRARARGRDENPFSDADVQMAGYAAALEVLTAYTHIDGADMTREALRPRAERRGRGRSATPPEVGLVEDMIALAVRTANELMVPEGIAETLWDRLAPASRFYLRMAAAEAGGGGGKLDDYQNFAKAYRAEGWEDLMADRTPNRARLKTASEFRGALLRGHPLSDGPLRPTLYAAMLLARDAEAEADPEASGKAALHALRDHFGEGAWMGARDNVRALAAWLGQTWQRKNPAEASAARVLAALVAGERL